MTPEQIISKQFPAIEQQMRDENIPQVVIDNFKYNYEKVVRGDTGYIDKTMLNPISALPKYAEMEGYEKFGEENISKVAIIKLNGGLGTGMGLDKAKTLLPAKDGYTFLDIIINQTLHLRKKYNCAVPLIFMNSFRTEQDTLDALKKIPEFESGQNGIPASFVQNQFKRKRILHRRRYQRRRCDRHKGRKIVVHNGGFHSLSG